MAEKKRTRWQRRPGTTGGKLPWNDWRNATTWRKATQLLLLAINIYIAITFWYWVRYYETAGSTTFITRPVGIEGWLPIAGLMNLKQTVWSAICPSPLAGYSSARREVFAVEFFSLYRVIDARSGDSLFYVVALQRGDGR